MSAEPVSPTVPKAVIFDWDNTLVETWPTIHEALRQTFVAMGVRPWTLDETKQRVRRSLREAFPELFGARWGDARDCYYAAYEAVHLETLQACPGAEAMLAACDERGLYLGVVSNKTGSYLRREADHLGWTRRFHRLVGAGDAVRDKPAPEPLAMALSATDLRPGADVWYVGDTEIDMELAHVTGCRGVLLRAEPPLAEEFAVYRPWRHYASCGELMGDLLGTLDQ